MNVTAKRTGEQRQVIPGGAMTPQVQKDSTVRQDMNNIHADHADHAAWSKDFYDALGHGEQWAQQIYVSGSPLCACADCTCARARARNLERKFVPPTVEHEEPFSRSDADRLLRWCVAGTSPAQVEARWQTLLLAVERRGVK